MLLESNDSAAVRGLQQLTHMWLHLKNGQRLSQALAGGCHYLSLPLLLCSVTSCRRVPPPDQIAIPAQQAVALVPAPHKQQVEAWGGVSLGCSLSVHSVQLKWQIEFIPELVCDMQHWISELQPSPCSDIGHHDKKLMLSVVLSEHIFALWLWGKGNGNSPSLPEFWKPCSSSGASDCHWLSLSIVLSAMSCHLLPYRDAEFEISVLYDLKLSSRHHENIFHRLSAGDLFLTLLSPPLVCIQHRLSLFFIERNQPP